MLDQRAGAFGAQRRIVAALHDAEQRAAGRRSANARLASAPPSAATARIARSISARLAGRRRHSSSSISMSEPSSAWISIARSGVSATRRAVDDASGTRTPSSSILRSSASDMTWKPPESVRIGCGQSHEAVQPAERRDRARRRAAASGDRCCRARCRRRRRAPRASACAFTAPAVPTGMKAGVRTVAARRVDHAGARRAVGAREA